MTESRVIPRRRLRPEFEEALENGLDKKKTTLAQTSGLPCPGKLSENDHAALVKR